MLPSIVRQAFADESFHEATVNGFYVLATVVFEPEHRATARDAMLDLRGNRATRKLHWNEMSPQQQRNAVKTVADLESFHIVTVGSPVPIRRQERARAACLATLVHELHGLEVPELLMESRTEALDRRDVETVRGARFGLPKGAVFRVGHLPGAQEALFWAADIIAGAVRAQHEGRDDYRPLLESHLYEIQVTTDC